MEFVPSDDQLLGYDRKDQIMDHQDGRLDQLVSCWVTRVAQDHIDRMILATNIVMGLISIPGAQA